MAKGIVLGSVLFLFSVCSHAAVLSPNKTKVVILGAGIAGITAAKTLYDLGIEDFLILEGQHYIGGRIQMVPFGDVRIETAANWIQYIGDDNPIWQLKFKHRLNGIMANYSNVRVR